MDREMSHFSSGHPRGRFDTFILTELKMTRSLEQLVLATFVTRFKYKVGSVIWFGLHATCYPWCKNP